MKLSLQEVVKRFGSHTVIDRVSLEFDGAHCLALIGPSGGGKSTLLRLVAGLEYPSGGAVVLNDKRIEYHDEALLRHRRSIGTVFQAFNLFPHMTALKNITLPLEKVHGRTAEEARDLAEGTLRRFQLLDHAQKRPAELSGGQRQRVAIARAIAIKPQVVLLDEPTSALDPEMTAEVLELIEELKQEGRDLLLVTHEMGFARRLADRVALLSEGRIAEFGPPEQIFGAPESEATKGFLRRVLRY
ncbi:MAG TPA: amino acid ABC transporter ATP-binding protein [Candidatus Methylacidiphilales bacterium]|jgi:polar amino acid transport system ATP-binding protein|nr:amino acid ABC transporter ATP-binding protein [Candidatus Methylacidiphilales bacterium]